MARKRSSRGVFGAAAFALTTGFVLFLADPSLESHAAGMTEQNPAGQDRPVVVELYTSQGCSSCPPADAILAELAGEPGILALEFHVDYWDYIGWKDPFASAQFTQRQHDYADRLGLRYVYTPQMVVDGRSDVVGSRRRAVTRAIAESKDDAAAVGVALEVIGESGGGRVLLSAGEAPEGGATVWLVTFDDSHHTEVARGENGGRALTNRNVVREMTTLGTWDGRAKEFPLDLARARAEGRGGCAVIVQQGRGGPILGAAMIDLDGVSG